MSVGLERKTVIPGGAGPVEDGTGLHARRAFGHGEGDDLLFPVESAVAGACDLVEALGVFVVADVNVPARVADDVFGADTDADGAASAGDDREIRPQLKKDGGDIELIDIVGDRVIIAFRGMCAGCHSAAFTRQDFIESKLREFVDPAITVEEEGK
jgi:Fe-S cluster biogenesis protein NfuA